MSLLQPGPHNCISESIQVLTKSHPGINLPPCRSHLNSIKVPHINVSHPSRSCLTSIQVSTLPPYHLHPGDFSPPSRSPKRHLISIQVPSEIYAGLNMRLLPASMPCLSFIHVQRFLSLLHPCTDSPPAGFKHSSLYPCHGASPSTSDVIPIQAHRFMAHPHPGLISIQSRSRYLYLTSFQVMSQLHLGPQNCIWAPSRSHLKPIQVACCGYQMHPGPLSPTSRT